MTKIINAIYLVASAVFFIFCAWAQVNDPDPELWVAIYVVGGAVLNVPLLFETFPLSFQLLALAFAVGCTTYSAQLTWLIAQKYREDFMAIPPTQWWWTFVEYEEGREVVGLMMLAIHEIVLLALRPSARPKKSEGKDVNGGESLGQKRKHKSDKGSAEGSVAAHAEKVRKKKTDALYSIFLS